MKRDSVVLFGKIKYYIYIQSFVKNDFTAKKMEPFESYFK